MALNSRNLANSGLQRADFSANSFVNNDIGTVTCAFAAFLIFRNSNSLRRNTLDDFRLTTCKLFVCNALGFFQTPIYRDRTEKLPVSTPGIYSRSFGLHSVSLYTSHQIFGRAQNFLNSL